MRIIKITISLILISTIGFCQIIDEKLTTMPIPAVLFSNKGENLKGGCYRIPSLVTTKDGTLIAVADERIHTCGDLKYNDDINLVMRKSFDNGLTWTSIEKIIDLPKGESTSDASMLLDSVTGNILLFYNYMDLKNAKDIYRQFYIKSVDNGKTWSSPIEITTQIAPKDSQKDFKFITSGRATQDKKGIIYQTLVDLQKGVFVFKSENHGNTWSLFTPPLQPADETNITILNNGNILLNARVKGLGFRKLCEFTPQGNLLKCSTQKDLKDPACNGAILNYEVGSQNILLFSNANDSKQRKNLTIKYSIDNGKNWSEGKIINPNSSAYSSLTRLKNNDVGILYEAENYTEIRYNTLPIYWILNIKEID